ncbi:glycerol-3-phosphate responsive antiterminator [Paenibacillus alkalitolerans]|uniref:glycerol-3-phosphate responsive antiterminator n=1 Tax=Paenibacillus alkalitolerans TaxID=2799335 RepID=UPI0018F355F6|nr:glycerol-3-phosphate responsive antiterminator [Paenibacillus alkalitolerans]
MAQDVRYGLFEGQKVLPAVRQIKELERLLTTPFVYIVLLGGRVGQLKTMVDLAAGSGKKVLLHADLIDGLKNDEYAAEFLCQHIRPAGLISTRTAVIQKTKQNKLLSIQRMFLIDSGALETSIGLVEKTEPDLIEVLPGILPHLIAEVRERTGIPVIAGGLIRTFGEVEAALAAGAAAITTSRADLWR